MNHSHDKVAFWKKHHTPTTNSSHSSHESEKHSHKDKHKSHESHCSNSNNDVQQTSNNKGYREAFNSVDSNFDGRITMIELKEAFLKLGHYVSDEDVEKMIQGADSDNNGTVEYEEFVELMIRFRNTKAQKIKNTDTEAYEVFKAFDHNGDDLLDFNEIKSTMIALGEQVTDDDVRAMIIEADLDRNGKIDFTEFKRIMEMFQNKSAQ